MPSFSYDKSDNPLISAVDGDQTSAAKYRAPESRNFTLSPETTDCDSADLESELSLPSAGDGSYHSSGPRIHTSMPILEVGKIKISSEPRDRLQIEYKSIMRTDA